MYDYKRSRDLQLHLGMVRLSSFNGWHWSAAQRYTQPIQRAQDHREDLLHIRNRGNTIGDRRNYNPLYSPSICFQTFSETPD